MPRRCEDRLSTQQALESVVRAARKSKVSAFEAFAVLKMSKRVNIESNQVSSADSTLSSGLHIRVSDGHKVGGAFCNTFDEREVARCVSEAEKVASICAPDSDWTGFPSCEDRYRRIDGLYDKDVASLGFRQIGQMAEDIIEGASSVGGGVSSNFGSVEAMGRSVGVANSSGIRVVFKETELRGTVACVAGAGATATPDCMDMRMSRCRDLSFEKMGARAGWIAAESSRIARPRTEKCEAVFSPMALGEEGSGLLNVLLRNAFSGQSVVRKASFLADKVGDQIWSDNITIDDNPLLSARCGSRPFDDEGVPSSRTRLVHRGRLEGFVWDSYHGGISGKGSTGNAVRDTSSGAVRPSPLCLRMAPGIGTLEKLISTLDRGYLVWGCQGAHTSNVETGGFSFVANPALLIEKGQVIGGVRGVMVSGNIIDLLADVRAVGSDSVDFGCTLMPSMVFRNVNITTG